MPLPFINIEGGRTMINLPKWVSTKSQPAFYDSESATAIEQTAKLYGAMQELIEEHNNFIESISKQINDFIIDTNGDYEVFQIAMRQEFQDFIDVVDVRLARLENDVVKTATDIVNNAIKTGGIKITEEYDSTTESLNLTGGV